LIVLGRRRDARQIPCPAAPAETIIEPGFAATSSEVVPAIWSQEEVLMKYKVALHRTDEGISVSVPALPGCWSEGGNEEEALANIQDAIREYLAALEERFQDAECREVEVPV
jgi:predicted RNase H-like HicB family nuclease